MEAIGAQDRPRRLAIDTPEASNGPASGTATTDDDSSLADSLAVKLYRLERKRKEVKGRLWRCRRAQRQNRWLLFGLYALALVASLSSLAAKFA